MQTLIGAVRNPLVWFAACVVTMGCGRPQVSFQPSLLRIRQIERDQGGDEPLTEEFYQQITDVLAAMFGTPDEPFFIADAEAGTAGFVQLANLARSAGPVTTDRISEPIRLDSPHLSKGAGLYRQHCVHCHGITGNGKGPTASFLNPYPRDFTKGTYKFNSTPLDVPPTEEDLRRILMYGIDGTAMPAFALLDSGEVEALMDYVKYLSVRGEMEKVLIEDAAALEEVDVSKGSLVDGKLADAVNKWVEAESIAPPEPPVPMFSEDRAGWPEDKLNELFDSVDRGRNLYYTAEANCYSCHGPTQLGDGNLALYDVWTKELFDWQTAGKIDPDKLAEHLALGGLEPRIIRPRNLRLGQYRGGRRPIDIYWRIHNGIDGSGMPNATLKNPDVPGSKGITQDDIWDLVNFVLSLPYEKLSRPNVDLPTNGRILN